MALKPKSLTVYARNIRRTFERSTALEITYGVRWYDIAQNEARDLSRRYGIPLETAALVIAALSPNNNWTRNISDAEKVVDAWYKARRLSEADRRKAYEAVRVCTYNRNKQTAFDILNGKRSSLNGRKTASFARNILGCYEAVTVDVHAYSIANGVRLTAKTCGAIPKRQYEAVSEAYRRTASDIGIDAPQLQAITWNAWRRIHSIR